MISYPYEVLGEFDELTILIARARALYADDQSMLRDYATELMRYAWKATTEGGDVYTNEKREVIASIEQTLQTLVPEPQGFVVPAGTEQATWWHMVRARARKANRLDVGGNNHLREVSGRVMRISFLLALKSNADAGVPEEPIS